MVDMTAPTPNDVVCDPACGTAGFVVAASPVEAIDAAYSDPVPTPGGSGEWPRGGLGCKLDHDSLHHRTARRGRSRTHGDGHRTVASARPCPGTLARRRRRGARRNPGYSDRAGALDGAGRCGSRRADCGTRTHRVGPWTVRACPCGAVGFLEAHEHGGARSRWGGSTCRRSSSPAQCTTEILRA